MLSIIKADINRLHYNKAIIFFTLAVIALCGYYFTNNGQIFASNDITGIGFYYKTSTFEDVEKVISSVLSFTYLYWILAVIFSILYFNGSKDSISILVSRGKSLVSIGISNLMLCNLIVVVGYIIGSFIIAYHVFLSCGILPNTELILLLLQQVGLCSMVYISFVSIMWLVCTFLRNPILSFTVLFLGTFGTFLVTLMQNNLEGFSLTKLLPMYYFLSLGGVELDLVLEVFIYFIATIIITLFLSSLALKRNNSRL